MRFELAAAAVLVVITLVLAYVLWYIVRGRYVRQRKQAVKAMARGNAPKREESRRDDGDWKKHKGSYCYPSINEVMGYEFVKVVNVTEAQPIIPSGNPVMPAPIKEEQKSWGNSEGTGFTTQSNNSVSTISSDGDPRTPAEGETYPEEGTQGRPADQAGGQNPEEEGLDPEESTVEYSNEDIKNVKMTEFVGGSWPNADGDDNKDFDESKMTPEMYESINGSPEMFGERGDPETDRKVSLNNMLLNEAQAQAASVFDQNFAQISDSTEDDNFGNDMLSSIEQQMHEMGEEMPGLNEQ